MNYDPDLCRLYSLIKEEREILNNLRKRMRKEERDERREIKVVRVESHMKKKFKNEIYWKDKEEVGVMNGYGYRDENYR